MLTLSRGFHVASSLTPCHLLLCCSPLTQTMMISFTEGSCFDDSVFRLMSLGAPDAMDNEEGTLGRHVPSLKTREKLLELCLETQTTWTLLRCGSTTFWHKTLSKGHYLG